MQSLSMHALKPRGILLAALVLLGAGACGGGARFGEVTPSEPFTMVRSDPPSGERIYLNDSLKLDFTAAVDPATVDASSVAFTVFDKTGQPLAEQPSGDFRIA